MFPLFSLRRNLLLTVGRGHHYISKRSQWHVKKEPDFKIYIANIISEMRLLRLKNTDEFTLEISHWLEFWATRTNESGKLVTSFRNVLLRLLVRNRFLHRCKMHLCVLLNSIMWWCPSVKKFFSACFRIWLEENDLCLASVDIHGQDASVN